MKMNLFKHENQNYMFCILIGIIVGCICCAVMIQNDNSIISGFMIEKEFGGVNSVSDKALLFYLLKKRICLICILICLSYLFSYRFVYFLILFLWGGYYGLFISMTLLCKNIQMFFYGLLCFFPHSLLYFFSILLISDFFTNTYTYGRTKMGWKKKNNLKYFLKIFVIICCMGIGIFFEFKSKFFLETFFTNI